MNNLQRDREVIERARDRVSFQFFFFFFFFLQNSPERQVIYNRTQGPLLGKLPNPNPPIQRTATTPGTSCLTLFE